MGKKYKVVVMDPDQVDNIVEHEISEMEGEALIKNAKNANQRLAPAAGEVNEDKAFSDKMLDDTRAPSFEEVKRKKLGY